MLSNLRRILKHKSPQEAHKEYLIKKGIKIGQNTNIYSWTTIDPANPWLIEIGDNVTISSDVTILTNDASPCKVGWAQNLAE